MMHYPAFILLFILSLLFLLKGQRRMNHSSFGVVCTTVVLGYFAKPVNCPRVVTEVVATFSPRRYVQLGSRAECVRHYGVLAEERLPLFLFWNTSSREFVTAWEQNLAQVRDASVRVSFFSLNLWVSFLIRSLAPKGNRQGFSNSLRDLAALCNLRVAEVLNLCTLMLTNVF